MLSVIGFGVTILCAMLMTVSDKIPAWFSIGGLIVGLSLIAFGVMGYFKSESTELLKENETTKIETVRTEEKPEPKYFLESDVITRLLGQLDEVIIEAEKGIPNSEADTAKLQALESSLRLEAAKFDGALSHHITCLLYTSPSPRDRG